MGGNGSQYQVPNPANPYQQMTYGPRLVNNTFVRPQMVNSGPGSVGGGNATTTTTTSSQGGDDH
jgi:hypothetical protein